MKRHFQSIVFYFGSFLHFAVGSDVVYVMQNRFLRVPEFANYYRNLSSHANKSFEDPILPHLLRALYGLSTSPTPLPSPQTCSSTAANFPSWNEVRDKLQISLQPSNVDALLVTKVSRSLQKLGEYQLGRGLMLTPPFQDDLLPGESRRGVETCFECQCQNFNIIPLGKLEMKEFLLSSRIYADTCQMNVFLSHIMNNFYMRRYMSFSIFYISHSSSTYDMLYYHV